MEKEFSSFRDNSGFIFWENGEVFRQVNHCYKEEYDLFIKSGLYDRLVSKGRIIEHTECETKGNAYKIIKPEKLEYISYPYEWSFSMLKDAALLTLNIHCEVDLL